MDRESPGASSLGRLQDVIQRFEWNTWGREVREGWTAAALLLQLAFWDHLTAARWRDALARGQLTPVPFDDELTDILNDALLGLLAAVPDDRAGGVALAAAREVEGLIAELPSSALEAVRGEGRPRLVDRSLHRNEHLDEIERALSQRHGVGSAGS